MVPQSIRNRWTNGAFRSVPVTDF